MFRGVVRVAVGFKSFSIELSDPRILLKKVDIVDGMCGSVCSIEKVEIEMALFSTALRMPDLVSDRKSPVSIPPIRLHKNWPNGVGFLVRQKCLWVCLTLLAWRKIGEIGTKTALVQTRFSFFRHIIRHGSKARA